MLSNRYRNFFYVVSTLDGRKSTQLCHVNLLNPYFCHAHENTVPVAKIKPVALVTEISNPSVSIATDSTEGKRVQPDCLIQPRLWSN